MSQNKSSFVYTVTIKYLAPTEGAFVADNSLIDLKMKQLIFEKKNTLRWRDIQTPQLEYPTDVMARPLAAARCDGDKVFLFYDVTPLMQAGLSLHYIDPVARKLFGNKPFKGPFPIGHECVAEITSCGDDVKKIQR